MTLSALGIFSAAGAGVAPQTFELIRSEILTSNQANVTFDVSSLASTYRHLQLRVTARGTRAEIDDAHLLRFNSDTGNNYAHHRLGTFNGSTVTSGASTTTNTLQIGFGAGGNTTTNAFTGAVVDILDAFSTTKNKTIRSFVGISANITYVNLHSGVYISTAAITSMTISPLSANLATGSRFSLYGIRG